MNLEALRRESAIAQKKGLHFILASVLIWGVVSIIHLTDLPIQTKNLLTFCSTAVLLPLAYLISRAINVDFQNKGNPLTQLGLLFSLNQMLYLLIAMWVYAAVPDKMIMVLAMIFGAHLLPYGWLYLSKSYYAFAIFIPIAALVVGVFLPAYALALLMVMTEIIFSISLIVENRQLGSAAQQAQSAR